MIPARENSKWMVRFPLRRDFAWEAGFVERARVPLSRREYEQQTASLHAQGESAMPYETVRAQAEAYQPPRFMGYVYCIAPGYCESWPLITDGPREFHVAHNGLWTGLEERINRALYLRRDQISIVQPRPVPRPASDPIFPRYFVLHDTVRGEAGLYPWADRFDYLEAACRRQGRR